MFYLENMVGECLSNIKPNSINENDFASVSIFDFNLTHIIIEFVYFAILCINTLIKVVQNDY